MDRAIITLRKVVLILGDISIFYVSLALAVWTRTFRNTTVNFHDHLFPFSAVFFLWFIVFYISGLYELTIGRNKFALLRLISTAMLISGATAVLYFYLVPGIAIAPKTTLFIDIVYTTILLIFWRFVYNQFLQSSRLRSKIIFIGINDDVRDLLKELKNQTHLGLDTAGVIVLDGSTLEDQPVRRTLEGFTNFVREQHADTVVLSLSPRTSPELARVLYESIFLKVRFVDFITFSEQIMRRVPLSAITHSWFLENLQEAGKQVYELTKRSIDIFGALILGTITLCLTPFIAFGIWMTDKGPIFFTQERIGLNGEKFFITKFRSMIIDAEKDGARFAEKSDKRVTKIGKILRSTRIDELPQCWNILIGDMSFIGPRPERPTFFTSLTEDMPYYPMRLLTRPGLSGWAQIMHGYYATPEEHRLKLQYDLYYIKNRSFTLDAMIALKTLSTVIRAKGQ